MNFLSDSEREHLKLQHRRERDGRIRDRIKAVLLYDDGWTPKDISRVLLISDEAERNHIDEYETSKKLKPEIGLQKNFLQTNLKNWKLISKRIRIFTSKISCLTSR